MVPPGATALTVICLSPQSFAMTRTNDSIAPLEPKYTECWGTLKVIGRVRGHEDYTAMLVEVAVSFAGDEELGSCVQSEDALIFFPAKAFSLCDQEKGLGKQFLTSVTSLRWPKLTTPALLQTISNPPNCATASSMSLTISDTLRMLACIAIASVPSSLMSWTSFLAA
ncbi:hypothetical protein BDW74DRAFT_153783 [Aspergillus multicolor]|uniref:uncharacterized protein n=1 Tax=Aspergillus multicolor TaxID=41759 RepID=UPI003CCCBFC7